MHHDFDKRRVALQTEADFWRERAAQNHSRLKEAETALRDYGAHEALRTRKEPKTRGEALEAALERFQTLFPAEDAVEYIDDLLYLAAQAARDLDFCDGRFANLVLFTQCTRRYFLETEQAKELPETQNASAAKDKKQDD